MNESKDNMERVKLEQAVLCQKITTINNIQDLQHIYLFIRGFTNGRTEKGHHKNERSKTSND